MLGIIHLTVLGMTSKELIAASNVPLVLSILTRGKSYGYLIIKHIREISGGHLEWSEPMLYPVLHRMERDGLIKSEWIIPENGRKRKYYAITEAGKAALHTKKEEWLSIHNLFIKLWTPQPSDL